MYCTPLDLQEAVIGGRFTIVKDLREEGVLVVGGRHDREEIVFRSLVRLLLSCRTFPPWS